MRSRRLWDPITHTDRHKGEEDLAALLAIAMAPISSVIIYGLPDKGAVVVRVTRTRRKKYNYYLIE